MSKSAILSSSIVKKYWMALTGLFLCLFLVGHLLGNLQLITHTGESGKLAFNEYAHFMATNPFIQIMAYLTYFSILFHAIDGFMLTFQNKKARPQNYAYNRPGTNSSTPSRYMAVLGTLVLVFICLHMANFWYTSKVSSEPMPLQTVVKNIDYPMGQDPQTGMPITQTIEVTYMYMTNGSLREYQFVEPKSGEKQEALEIKNGTEIHDKRGGIKIGEGYKDLHGLVLSYFGKKQDNYPIKNDYAWLAVLFYTISMAVLAFHLWHGFASAFQTLGLRTRKFAGAITSAGKIFAILIPLAFALIPILIYFS